MTIPVSSKGQGANARAESSKKAKLLITLQRSPDFFENMRKFSEIKEENERLAKKNEATAETKADKDEKWASILATANHSTAWVINYTSSNQIGLACLADVG